jgi:hypothetical protein
VASLDLAVTALILCQFLVDAVVLAGRVCGSVAVISKTVKET